MIVNLLGMGMLVYVIAGKGGFTYLESKVQEVMDPRLTGGHETGYAKTKLSVYDSLPVSDSDTVFLGDSLLGFGEWSELMGTSTAKNRAVFGDTIGLVAERTTAILKNHPRHIVLLCGINDLQQGITVERAEREYEAVVTGIVDSSSKINVWLLPVMGVNQELYRTWIQREHPEAVMPQQLDVDRLNQFIFGLAKIDPRIHVVKVPAILNEQRQINARFTVDGLHLNGRGLVEIAKALKTAMNPALASGDPASSPHPSPAL
ncbi:MAG: lysophospholipase L1-like esterase [Verrucomicrobia bacterium]|nr:lysophospholipase L1-like esterase [Verrucomicrobiota bacterium]